MNCDKNIKEEAKKLRSEGKTYSEIKTELKLAIPKSTLSNWCKNVVLPDWYQGKINQLNILNFSKAQKMAWASNKANREKFLNNLSRNNEYLIKKLRDEDILKALLSILYLGEGSKWKSHRGLMLGSSDPNIIKLYIRLLNLCYGIKSEKLKCRISYRADQDLRTLEKYWSDITEIPASNFYKTIPDPRTKGKPTKNKNYKGVCVIMCAGTAIQLELEMIPKLILKGI